MAFVGIVQRVRLAGGRAVLDCYLPGSGQFFRDVPIATSGGGADGWAFDPPIASDAKDALVHADPDRLEGAQVVLVSRPGKLPIAIATLQHPHVELTPNAPSVDLDADHPCGVGLQDFARVNGGTKQIHDANGAWTLDLKDATDPTVRVQFPSEGVLRLSRDSEAAERLVLAGPLVTYLQQVQDYLAAVQAWTVATAATLTGHGVTALAATMPTLTPDALRAAVLHVSADSEQGV